MGASHGSDDTGVVALDTEDCWSFLRSQELGRLAIAVDRMPDIYPVNYAVDHGTVVIRTAPGTKLLELSRNEHVAFEADRWNPGEAVSVVIRGRARLLESAADIRAASRLDLDAWVLGPKPLFLRIHPDSISGRRLRLAPRPTR